MALIFAAGKKLSSSLSRAKHDGPTSSEDGNYHGTFSFEMAIETALFFETVEEIYARVFVLFRPRAPLPRITVRFRKYANANSRIRLSDGQLQVDISDLLQAAPAPIQEALAHILLAKLFRKPLDASTTARYRRYLNRGDVRRTLHKVKQERGRKSFLDPQGAVHNLCSIFDEINLQYFNGLMARPQLGWSLRPSRTTLGHYDPAHHVIVLSRILDRTEASILLLRYVMFHEMLHLRFPTENRGSRRCVHTRDFKAAEKRFDNYGLARIELRKFVDQQLRALSS